ncbi:MAG TPA: molybdopterin-dependent oxidoreductase [Syntrophorhabdaceae bacterium]|nr:molybdopterin-dependent oxidoreductase [Syntrophorhabdaceae bacterium]
MGAIEKKPAICGVCPGGCGIVATVKNGKLIKVEPDKDVPYGNLCIRGRAAPEIVYSPDRLTTPLIRTGKKGNGEFRAATWDEAIDLVAERMKEIRDTYGAHAFVYHSGRGAFEESLHDFSEGFLYPYGSPNMASVGSLCFVSYGILAPVPTFGIGGSRLIPDIENSKMIVVWGANPITDSPPTIFERIVAAQKRGVKIIAIDHMKSDIARRADQWVAVRSGTDGALALGMIRVIINEGLYDTEFVEKWTVGFEDLKTYVQSFIPEEVERITGVSGEIVVNLAREIAVTKHASLRMYTGLEYTNSGVQNIRAVYLLWALAGHLDVPGGLLIAPPAQPFKSSVKVRLPEGVQAIGSVEYPLFHELIGNAQFMEFPRAVLEGKPYPVKGLLNNGASTLTSYPQPELWEKAYEKLDFMAIIDLFMTGEARYADVILPAATYFEISSYQSYPDYVRLRQPVIRPVGEARNSLLILAGIADRLGYGDKYPQTEDEIIREAFNARPELLAAMASDQGGVRLDQPEHKYRKYELGLLRRDGRAGFNTPSGKVEITSGILAKHGYDALPIYRDPVEGPLHDPELHCAYPLVLNTGARIMNTFRSQHQNIPSLVKLQDKPRVLMNALDARRREIEHGDMVIVRTKRGEAYFWADVSDKAVAGSVEVNVGGGKPIQVEGWRDGNANVLTDFNNRDPISGFPVFKALLCEIEKA